MPLQWGRQTEWKDDGMITVQTKAMCRECGRVFDLLSEDDAQEWYYGHDCEDI